MKTERHAFVHCFKRFWNNEKRVQKQTPSYFPEIIVGLDSSAKKHVGK